MTDEAKARERLAAAGYMQWANDLSGRTYVAPDGLRLLSFGEALHELEGESDE